jgi:hypothetical protein
MATIIDNNDGNVLGDQETGHVTAAKVPPKYRRRKRFQKIDPIDSKSIRFTIVYLCLVAIKFDADFRREEAHPFDATYNLPQPIHTMIAAAAAVVAKLPPLLLLTFLCLHEGSSFSYLAYSQSHQCRHQHQWQCQHNRHQSTSRWRWRIYHRLDADDVNNKGIVDTDLRFHPNKLFNNLIVSEQNQQQYRRRNVFSAVATKLTTVAAAAATTSTILPFIRPTTANAAVGSLPELSSTNAILQSITIDTIDKSQFDETIAFFTGGAFEGMKLLREKNIASSSGGGDDKNGMVQEAWIGFGPEMLSIPPTFTLPVSSFAEYGGHASIHVRYDPQQFLASSPSSTEIPLPQYYQRSSGEYNNAPPTGDNIAYLQLGVPTYRISQMVKNYGNILDAYGWVNVISPCGLPVRAIVGIRPDPIMFLAINCLDVKKSEEFYYEQLGFVRQVSLLPDMLLYFAC